MRKFHHTCDTEVIPESFLDMKYYCPRCVRHLKDRDIYLMLDEDERFSHKAQKEYVAFSHNQPKPYLGDYYKEAYEPKFF